MSKKQHKKSDHIPAKPAAIITAAPSPKPNKFSILNFRTQAYFLAFIGLIFYCNTFSNEYAFDDMMAIVDNDYVQQGISGIPKILTTDAYQSYLEHKNGSNQLAGGRYRPLSLITFAIEQQFLGVSNPDNPDSQANHAAKEATLIKDMHFRHFINVMLYLITTVVLFIFLNEIVFPCDSLIPFIAALLFTIHPIHTEVVANVKSLDEILSVLFISLTFIQIFRYNKSKNLKNLVWSLVCFFLALLSKEYAVTLIVLLPLSFFIFQKESIAGSFIKTLPFLMPLALYLLLRFSAVSGPAEGAENNIMNNPYLFATGMQKLATELLVMLNYIKLLFLPHPLIADYSYNQIPYTNFSNPLVWASILIYTGLVLLLSFLVVKRHALSFALAIYLLNLALICNILFNIGAPMGERLVFHSSIGFCTIFAYFLVKGTSMLKPTNIGTGVLVGIMLILVILCGFKTIDRNKDWKNNNTLFLHDVSLASNSVLVNNDAAAACMSLAKNNVQDTIVRNQWLEKAISYFTKAISLHPKYSIAYLNRGLCYFNSGNPDKALTDWDTVRVQSPDQQNLAKYLSIAGKYFMNQAMKNMQSGNPEVAITQFKRAIEATPNAPEIWYNLGIAYMNTGNNEEAKHAFEKTLQLSPKNPEVLKMLEKLK
jgi:tetratricopeptide (TPR) repeat protein